MGMKPNQDVRALFVDINGTEYSLSNPFPITLPGSLDDDDIVKVALYYNNTALDPNAPVETQQTPGVPTITSVNASASSASILASNADRIDALFTNTDVATCRVKCGTTASATSFSFFVYSGQTVPLPYPYQGAIDAIWDTANGGKLIVTEFEP